MIDDSLMLMAGWALALVSQARSVRARVQLARAAHEIRGPLCAAGLALAADRLDAVERELRRAGLAVADLDGPRRARREAFDVAELLRASEGSWRTVAEAHGARLAVTAPREAWLRGDPDRLAQAVANLVANAAEHGGGKVRVAVEAEGAHLRVLVADDGRGLPDEVAARLVGGRDRALAGVVGAALARGRVGRGTALSGVRRSARRRAGDSGMLHGPRAHDPRRGHGLAIVAAVARLHGGRLSHRRSASGAVLVLELPVGGPRQRMAGLRTTAKSMRPRPLLEALS